MDKQVLPVTGTYSVFVDPKDAYVGTTNVTLFDASDVAGSIHRRPKDLSEFKYGGEIVYMVYLKKPDGTTIAQAYMNNGGFIDTLTLDTTGTYTIFVDPYGGYTGSVTATLYNVPADVSGPITIGGSSVPFSITSPGQKALFSFNAIAGQKVSPLMTGVTIPFSVVRLSNMTLTLRDASDVTGTATLG